MTRRSPRPRGLAYTPGEPGNVAGRPSGRTGRGVCVRHQMVKMCSQKGCANLTTLAHFTSSRGRHWLAGTDLRRRWRIRVGKLSVLDRMTVCVEHGFTPHYHACRPHTLCLFVCESGACTPHKCTAPCEHRVVAEPGLIHAARLSGRQTSIGSTQRGYLGGRTAYTNTLDRHISL